MSGPRRTLAELAQYYDVLPNQIQSWKRQLAESAEEVFNRTSQRQANSKAEQIAALQAKVGQLTMENDFLERGLERIHGPRGKGV